MCAGFHNPLVLTDGEMPRFQCPLLQHFRCDLFCPSCTWPLHKWGILYKCVSWVAMLFGMAESMRLGGEIMESCTKLRERDIVQCLRTSHFISTPALSGTCNVRQCCIYIWSLVAYRLHPSVSFRCFFCVTFLPTALSEVGIYDMPIHFVYPHIHISFSVTPAYSSSFDSELLILRALFIHVPFQGFAGSYMRFIYALTLTNYSVYCPHFVIL